MYLDLYRQAREKWREKLAYFERQLAIISDVPQKFALKEQIKECEVEIKRLDAIIAELENNNEESILDNLPGTPRLDDISITTNTDLPTTPMIRTGHTVDNLPTYLNGQNVAHLIVAVFWSASGQKILVQVELCYTDPDLKEIVREPVLKED